MILGIFRLVSNHWIISPGVLHICRMIDQWSINLIMGKIMGQDDNMDLKINGRLTSESSYFLNMSQNLGKWRWSYSYRLNQDFSWENAGFPGAETAEFRGTWELQHGPVVNTFETGIGMIPLDVMGYKSYIYIYIYLYISNSSIVHIYIYMYICICIVIYIYMYIHSIHMLGSEHHMGCRYTGWHILDVPHRPGMAGELMDSEWRITKETTW